ncbi:GNAT family N-acetyltransferase [Tenacibaculum sp. nBUS_03]|uniref:GNAT family N-acetyltransferase n=1 Tax=Tenacibaculum sp. nBUS_03 TaxID=3395320 RepID=UPI003EBF9B8F
MIQTERLLIQKPDKEDFLRFYEINSDPKTNIYNPNGEMDYETAEIVFKEILIHWRINDFGVWKISERNTPNYTIGFGGLTYKNYEGIIKLNLGFRFDKLFFGKGYATEFGRKAIGYGFEVLKKSEIFGLVRPKNINSINVLKKCNLKLHEKLNDVPNEEDSLVYRIEKTDG